MKGLEAVSRSKFVQLKKVFGYDKRISWADGSFLVGATANAAALQTTVDALATKPSPVVADITTVTDNGTSVLQLQSGVGHVSDGVGCLDKIATLVDLRNLIGTDCTCTPQTVGSDESDAMKSVASITQNFLEMGAYIACCSADRIVDKELVELLQRITSVMESVVLSFDSLSVFIRECMSFESHIFERSDVYEDDFLALLFDLQDAMDSHSESEIFMLETNGGKEESSASAAYATRTRCIAGHVLSTGAQES